MDMAALVKNKTVLAIMGPTATGKTALALQLATKLPIEIISVDSALIYRDMDIGTAKPTADELAAVPHHLINILDPAQAYSASEFVSDSKRLVEEIHQRGRLPVLVGGTMMYFHALQQGLAELPSADAQVRANLQQAYQQDPMALHQKLQQVDPIAAERIHPNDPQRLVRALEVYELSGETLTALQARQSQQSLDWKLIKVGLIPQSREQLHQYIAARLQQMFAAGFLDEVKRLHARADLHADLPSIRSVGYRQAWLYLNCEIDQADWQEQALIATRQLAKRQLTWLRKEQQLNVLDPYVLTADEKLVQLMDLLHKNS